MGLLVFFSFMWFRIKSYEVFLLIHIGLSVIMLVGLYQYVTADSKPDHIPDAQGVVRKEIQVLAAQSSSETPSETDRQSSHHEHPIFHDTVGQQKLTFIVRPFGGWTKRLREQCLKSPTGVITPHIFIEGPYGEHSPLHTYENVVFVVGGTGISGALPYLQEHIKMTANDARPSGTDNKLTTRTRDITLIWSAKQDSMIRDIAVHELKPMLGRNDIHIHLYATSSEDVRRSLELNKISSEGAEKNLDTSASSSLGDELGIEYHRPDVRDTIQNVINDVDKAGPAGGRIAILTCGPAGMADAARAAVHAALKQGKRGVEYFEETFG
ncbi:hypothetical protein DV737_g2339, partial [Chaetothyriales sp. CBS 132003]